MVDSAPQVSPSAPSADSATADPTADDLFTQAVTDVIGGMGIQIYLSGQRNAQEAAKLREEE